MPRAYNEQEREHIKLRLLEVAEVRFTRFGLNKTSIDELVRDAGIGKGSFYLFFDSKESLFFELQEQIEADIKKSLIVELGSLRKNPPQMIRRFFQIILDVLERHPFLSLVTEPGVLEQLMRYVSAEEMAKHRREDEVFYKKLFRDWIKEGHIRNIDADRLFGFVTALFILYQQKALLGEQFVPVVSFLIDSVCGQITRGQTKR